MKKALILSLMISLIVLALVSCGGNEGNGGEQTHTHSFGEWETVEPATCVDKGEKVRYCDCGEMQTGVISATGEHNEVVDKAVAPTCTEAGLTEGKHCSVCKEVLVKQGVEPKGHALLDGKCERCDYTYSVGLEYVSNGDGVCYLSGIGTCTDTNVVIPEISPDGDSVTSIGEFAFYGCSSLASVVIPDSVTSIGSQVFDSCSALKDVYYTGSEEEWAKITIGSSNSNLTNATKHYNYVPEN